MSRDYHSITNQKILKEFVNREVIMGGTDIVEYVLRNCQETEDAPFTYDDIENEYRKICYKCNGELKEIEEDEIEVKHKWQCNCCGENFDAKEEAMKCCYENEEEREGLEETDMVKEIWICPFCEDEHESEEEAKECICHWQETMYKCCGCDEYILERDTSEEVQEAYEWWFVSNFLAEKLAEQGELVIRGWHNIWGRQGTGQAILLDYVIGQIAEEMGILEGMENDWSKF